jgi:hypothetical protein
VPESSDQGAGEGMEGPVGSPWVGRRWRGDSLAASVSAMVVTAVELKSGGNERGRTPGQCDGEGCSGAFHTTEGRSEGGWPLKGMRRHSGAPL